MKWPWRKEKKTRRVNPQVFNRSYVAGETSRLYNWQTGTDRSADGEIKDRLKTIRKRSRELIQNEPLAKKYISLLNTQVLGRYGIRLQMKARNDDKSLDIAANNII